MARALALSPRVDPGRLMLLWQNGAASERAVAFEVLGRRTPAWLKPQIDPALRSGVPAVMAAGLRAVCNAPDRAFLEPVQEALQRREPEVRQMAIAAGIALGSKTAWSACRYASAAAGASSRFPLGLLATSPDPNDRAFVAAKARDPASGRHAMWALGFAGSLDSAETLIASLAAGETTKVAGEALSAITGVVIAGKLAEPGQPTEPQAAEVADADPPPVVRTEDFLPVPKVDAVVAWWGRERARFRPGLRYIYGLPRNAETLHAALMTAPTWRRRLLRLELGAAAESAPAVDLQDWAREQIRQLRRPAAPSPLASR
jgi:uncharacterized protein (TIGR02270 family)